MKSTKRVPQINPEDNGEHIEPPDVREPENVTQADLEFNPADLEAPPAEPPPPDRPDPFDPASLRLSGDLDVGAEVEKPLTTLRVRKPDKSWFFRIHPDPAYRLLTALIELKDEREIYLVARPLWAGLVGESTFCSRLIVTAINRQGDPFLWPLKMPGPDGRIDDWSRSAREAADLAMKRWTRLQANMGIGAYDISYASAELPEPKWPALGFAELLRVAFRERFIDTHDHPILRRLRGEV